MDPESRGGREVKARALVEKETLQFTLQEKKENCKKKAISLERLLETCKIFFLRHHIMFSLKICFTYKKKRSIQDFNISRTEVFLSLLRDNFRAKW